MEEKVHIVLDRLYLLCILISGMALFIMTVVIPIGVFNRYVLGHGSMWPEPLAILCMITFTFIGAAASYRSGGHIVVSMITDRVPANIKRLMAWGVHLLMIILALFIARFGFSLCSVTWNQYIAEFEVLRVGMTYLPLPIGSIITLVFIFEHICFGAQHSRKVVAIGNPGSNNDKK